MEIRENVSLKHLNTFGIDVKARYLAEIGEESEVKTTLNSYGTKPQLLILGGGSNVLFAGHFEGLIIKNNILGRELLKEDHDYVWVKLGAGENWHDIVLWAIENGWGGIENLSLIPGTVGAAPMQNIGAYGVEICSVFEKLEAIDLSTLKLRVFDANDCQFGYRHSVFKGALKNQYLITRVVLKLQKHPVFNTSYGAVSQTLKARGIKELTLRNISDAIISIRESKLPNPDTIGNAGSFFKNPTVDRNIYNNLKTAYANIPNYPTEDGLVKIPAGWLIEQCDWKGFRKGAIGVHKNQALVLVNYGGANGEDLVQLSKEIQSSVNAKFGIELTPEVNIV
ncbi:MAG: UDP-N-acetylenolpyruvoylglucosamine reductase [Cyclobacteriaceae bacterium]|nr:MAG: UDP-N-acetylenolpyruvoylglucosamine reductase [Cyclobacteriaceae bacterium]